MKVNVKVKSLSRVRLCDPVDCSLSGSSIRGILQARVLEWVAISFSRRSSHPGIEPGSPALQADALPSEPPGKLRVKSLSRVRLFATPWTVAYQAPPSMGFSRQEYCNGLPFSSPGDLPNSGIEPGSPALQADSLPSEPSGKPVTLAIGPFEYT